MDHSDKDVAGRSARICLAIGGLILCCASVPALAATKCQIAKVVELPITMNDLRPVIPVKINNQDAKFILDSGAFYSTISEATANEYKLKLMNAPFGMRIVGIGGEAAVRLATVKDFGIVGVTLKNIEFLVGGSDIGYAGLLGQNLLQNFDVEYDLAHGAIRLFKTQDCEHVRLAYWLQGDQAYSTMKIDRVDLTNPHTVGVGYLNGEKIRVMFDSGAYTSSLTAHAAEKVGVKPDSTGVERAGYSTGLGQGAAKSYLATFASLKIGDGEEIKNARLRFAEWNLPGVDMLLGADFFVSHRIFVANREHVLYLSYNGGPVFNLSHSTALASDAPDEKPDEAGAAGAAAPGTASADAAEVARHGSALAARRDYAAALAELSKAIALAPNEPEYYFQRANTYRSSGQADQALKDFDHVIALKQDFSPAYLARAEINADEDAPSALTDLDALDRMAAKSAEMRLAVGRLYQHLDRIPASIAQFDLWIEHHPNDSRLFSALTGRCVGRLLLNEKLDSALSDCNTVLRRIDKTSDGYANLLADRGLVRLRQGDLAKALTDFNDALKSNPKNAPALYGRGIVESRTNKKSESEADLRSAKEIEPKWVERYARYGIVP